MPRLALAPRLAPFGFAAPLIGAAALALATPAAAQDGAAAALARDQACQALGASGLFADATVSEARMSAPAAGSAGGAYCEVKATLSPVAGSHIGVVYRLPLAWNGRVVGYGGGGWAGNVRIETVAADLARGYATMQTDGGHPSPNAGDATWTAPGGKPDEIALSDFAWRAVHAMTVTGKQVAARFYGRAQDKALFIGCSTGGRMALMEAQRFPTDYDGIVSGAPVYSLRVQLGEIYRDWVFTAPGAALQPGHIKLIHEAVLAQCDAADGVKDGILSDPAACKFDPAQLKCQAGQAADQCLNDAQIAAVRRLYTEAKGSDGVVYVYPYSRGSEPGWLQALNITADPDKAAHVRDLDLRAAMFGDPNFSFAAFDVARDGPRARATAFAKYYEAVDPDLKPFLSRGGKLILWHGLDDQLPSPWGTVAYDQQMRKAVGSLAADTRLFLAPGVLHCGGGPGPSSMDLLGALDSWVKTGVAPERVTATRPQPTGRPQGPGPAAPAGPFVPMTRPVCAYPTQARYDGKGDPNVEASFTCR